MRVFIIIWLGQLISQIGSSLTDFAIGIWVYQQTNSTIQFALIALCAILPRVIISPLGGVLVDHFKRRRWVMVISNCGAGLSIGVLALLLFSNRLEVWHIYLAIITSNCFHAFQLPTFTAATTHLVPARRLKRATGMIQLMTASAQLISPLLGGILITTIGLQGVILLDCSTFTFALITLLLVRFGDTKSTVVKKFDKSSLLRQISYGLTYITSRPGLLGLLIFFAANNFLTGVVSVLATPLVLSFAHSPAELGRIMSIGGIGMIIGSLIMSNWKKRVRYIYGVFGFMLLGGLCMIVAGLRPSVPLFTFAAFLFFIGVPIIDGCTLIIFQKKVPLDVQGRAFSLNMSIAQACMCFAYAIAGPLADKVFEPLMTSNSPLSTRIGHIIGVGHGRGIGLMFIVIGFLTMLATVVAYQFPHLRRVENELQEANSKTQA